MNISFHLIDPLDSTISYWLRGAKNISTFLSVASVIFTCYIIIRTIGKANKEYSILQLIVVILGIANDIDAQLIFDPIFLLPLPCVVRNAPSIPIPGSARWHYVIWVGIVVQQAPAFIACYIHRHQVVLLPNSSWRISPVLKNLLIVSYCVIIESPTILLRRAFASRKIVDYYAQFMSSEWPVDLIERMDCSTVELLQPYIQCSSVLHIFSVCIVVMLIIHTFRQLKQSVTLSEKRRKSQRMMIQLLIIQSIFPVLMQVLPNLAGFTVFIMEWSSSVVWPVLMLMLSTNSFAHSIVLLGATPIYRRHALYKVLGKIAAKKISPTVVSMAHQSTDT